AERGRAQQEACERDRSADRKRHGSKRERRDRAGRDRHDRQQRPHQDGGQSDKGGSPGGHFNSIRHGRAGHVFASRLAVVTTKMPRTRPGMKH
ncbi:hypothetical protein NS44R_15060, partial [Mammaliicoccus sciuri]